MARYSDSKGYVYAREERFWTHASAYRDWVVRFFNDDRPINDFLLLQLAAENPVSVHDLHATMLHLLGFDHERLTFRYAGRDFRLTDVHGRVIREIVA